MNSLRSASEDPTKVELLKDALYQAVVDGGNEGRLWNQNELLELDIIPEQNLMLLMKTVQGLCQDFLFKAMNDGRQGLCWKYRTQEDANKYKQLNQDQIMVYELIDDAGADGIWARNLKTRLNMHESVMKQCVKHLESKGYIRDMKSVENLGKKMYIKATLRPSDRATGGAWYTDWMLDEDFIHSLQAVVFDLIRNRCAYLSRHGGSSRPAASVSATVRLPKRGVIRGGIVNHAEIANSELHRGKKRHADALSTGEDEDLAGGTGTGTGAGTRPPPPLLDGGRRGEPNGNGHGNGNGHSRSQASLRHNNSHHHPRRKQHSGIFLPMPAGFQNYPTVRKIAELIEEAGITNNEALGEADIQQLIDVLVYDGLLEAVKLPNSNEVGYRTLNISRLNTGSSMKPGDDNGVAGGTSSGGAKQPQSMGAPPISNGLTETPCGLCPVFDLCEDGGPVSPSNCVYFNEWLGLDEAIAPTVPPVGVNEGVDA